jgi:hypothetical protein
MVQRLAQEFPPPINVDRPILREFAEARLARQARGLEFSSKLLVRQELLQGSQMVEESFGHG